MACVGGIVAGAQDGLDETAPVAADEALREVQLVVCARVAGAPEERGGGPDVELSDGVGAAGDGDGADVGTAGVAKVGQGVGEGG